METKVTFKVGDKIKIVKMDDKGGADSGATAFNGSVGVVEYIDDMGQLHGTWGGLAVIPEIDIIEKIG
jgi:hypothetical protein